MSNNILFFSHVKFSRYDVTKFMANAKQYI